MASSIRPHTFTARDLVGGHLAVDLVNTVTARNAEPVDWLDGYPRLLEWAALTGHFSPADLTALRELADAEPGPAEAALDRIRELREALHELLTALIGQEGPAAAGAAAATGGVTQVERDWKDAVAQARLTLNGTTPRLHVEVRTSGLDFLRHELALQAFDLLRALPLERARVCPGPRCGWLFLDSSRGGRRRWCSMATCGNSAKGRTHYERNRAGTGSSADSPTERGSGARRRC
ncbi:CGNR zinc finger domain-containing protein [Streptomyces sp. NPDC002825]|uniref:CGNR zinc finger domain-containing protein n=1 Tax=Streptomyces sp. NPDC002825 TaxID=3154666 RepID=UPI0033192758